ncbi:MAG: hypothetical protein M1817_004074 [Caeruleum heppii]|nr:MAG: hypothetical protein M1817_004074 [Caeruleum heppii]
MDSPSWVSTSTVSDGDLNLTTPVRRQRRGPVIDEPHARDEFDPTQRDTLSTSKDSYDNMRRRIVTLESEQASSQENMRQQIDSLERQHQDLHDRTQHRLKALEDQNNDLEIQVAIGRRENRDLRSAHHQMAEDLRDQTRSVEVLRSRLHR